MTPISRLSVSALLVAPALLLAGCGKSGAEATPDEIAERLGSVDQPEPGMYRSTMTVTEFDMPGAPAEMKDMMTSAMGRSFEQCLTKEEAERGFEEMVRQGQDDSCTFERFDVDGNEIDAAMTCNGPGSEPLKMTMTGKAGATSSNFDMTMKGDFSGMGEGTVRMSMESKRIGDCPA